MKKGLLQPLEILFYQIFQIYNIYIQLWEMPITYFEMLQNVTDQQQKKERKKKQ